MNDWPQVCNLLQDFATVVTTWSVWRTLRFVACWGAQKKILQVNKIFQEKRYLTLNTKHEYVLIYTFSASYSFH